MTASDNGDWHPPSLADDQLRSMGVLSVDSKITRGGPPGSISREKYWYLWGLITYEDGFGEKRRTPFCHRYNTEIKETPPGGGYLISAENSRQHDHGNDAD